MGPAEENAEKDGKAKRKVDPRERTGIYTSGIVSTKEGRKIALYFTGREHAGENLRDLLARRRRDSLPIQMCDALSRNMPKELKTIIANCNAHNRRKYVEVLEKFPLECRFVLEALSKVYKNDEITRELGMTPEDRLRFHQLQSGPIMEELHGWLETQFNEKKVEPNSSLGDAISYSLDHWEKLTLFLREPGAPLDNNVCENALKKAIIHRKNSLLYKTEHGAEVGDVFMSLAHTCQLAGEDPFHYITVLQRHAEELAKNPKEWMPWNYRVTLARIEQGEKQG